MRFSEKSKILSSFYVFYKNNSSFLYRFVTWNNCIIFLKFGIMIPRKINFAIIWYSVIFTATLHFSILRLIICFFELRFYECLIKDLYKTVPKRQLVVYKASTIFTFFTGIHTCCWINHGNNFPNSFLNFCSQEDSFVNFKPPTINHLNKFGIIIIYLSFFLVGFVAAINNKH